MKIEISTQNLMDEVDAIFLRETASTDLPTRGMVIQYLNEANAKLMILLDRFCIPDCQHIADDSLAIAETFGYDLMMSERRIAGKLQGMTDTMHSYLVNSALVKLYSNMSQADLSSKHAAQQLEDTQTLTRMIHTKRPPLC